jgi:hypothetical protein
LEGLGPRGAEKSRKGHKWIKRKQGPMKPQPSKNTKLHEVIDLEDLALVGHFIGRIIIGDTLKA